MWCLTLITWLQLNASIKERAVNTVHAQWTVKFVHSKKIAEQLQLTAGLSHTDLIKLRILILAICKKLAQNNQHRLLQAVQSKLLSILCSHQWRITFVIDWAILPNWVKMISCMNLITVINALIEENVSVSAQVAKIKVTNTFLGDPYEQKGKMSWAFRNHLAFL